jgi:hypothetical protein
LPRFTGLGAALALAALLLSAGAALAQKPPPLSGLVPPQLFVLTPRGAKAGTTVDVTLAGVALEDIESLVFSHPGIKAELIKTPPPPPPDPKKKGPRQPPAPTESRFRVTVPADTPLGIHDVRVIAKGGISNPRAFVVGDLDEVLEKEPNNDVAQAQRVELNSTVNGVIATPADVDYFIFAGKKGQRVVISCLTTSIDSMLPAALEIYDSKDRQLAFNRSYNSHDALTDCTLPADGDYYIRLYGFTYTQGGPNFFYRLSITTAPWIDAVYPPMAKPGQKAQLTVYGRNLPGGKLDPAAVVDGRTLEKLSVTIDVPKDSASLQRLVHTGHVPPKSSALDGFDFRLKNDSGTSNPYLLTYAQASVVLDNEANDTPETSQEVTLPCEIAGRIEKKRDRDWYTFSARRGDVYSIEAYADRLGSPIDLYMILREAKTKRVLIELDDNPDILNRLQFFTRSDDPPRYRFQVPADGDYQLMVSSREASVHGGPRDCYRVRITPEQPDFRLVVMPSSLTRPAACVVRRGSFQDLSVFVWRQDGWKGDVSITVEGLPEGVTCQPLTISGGVREAALILKADPEAPLWAGTIKIRGTAQIDGKQVVHEARPATITWPVPPQNVSTVSRLDRELVLAVRESPPFTLEASVTELVARHNSRLTIPLTVKRLRPDFKAPIRVFAFPQQGKLNFQPIQFAPGRDKATLVINVPGNIPPGVQTLIVRGQAFLQPRRPQGGQQPLIFSQPSTPIQVTVVPTNLATVSLSPSQVRIAPGSRMDIEVRVANRFDFTGDYQVRLIPGRNAQGLHADDVTIPAGKNRARLTIEVNDDAQPGTQFDAIVRATIRVGKTPVTQESRLSVAVVKPETAQAPKPPPTKTSRSRAAKPALPLVFSDDFTRGADRWQPNDPAAWKVVSAKKGKMYRQFQQSKYQPPHRSPFNFTLVKDLSVGDFILEASVQSTGEDNPHRDMCLFFGYQDPAHYYYVHIANQADDHANQIFIVNDAPRKKISTRTTRGTVWDDQWHRVKIVRTVADGKIEVYFDDMKKPIMTATDKNFTHGRVGVGSFDDTGNWKDVKVFGMKAGKGKKE